MLREQREKWFQHMREGSLEIVNGPCVLGLMRLEIHPVDASGIEGDDLRRRRDETLAKRLRRMIPI
jgi:hypothetical protein